MKCDEAKPKCQRCLKAGITCDGYGAAPNPVRQDRAAALRPTFNSASSILLEGSRDFHLSRPLLPGTSFRTDADKLYFDTFRKDLISKIAGPVSEGLWDNIVLPACHDEPWILDSVVAIAAISISNKYHQNPTIDPYHAACSKTHQQVALARYGQAIQAMKLTLTNEDRHLRLALIACLLVFCFEGFQGYHKLALLHVNSGYQLLKRWLASKSYGTPALLKVNPHHISAVVEQDLIKFFSTFHLQAVSTVPELWTSESDQEETDGDIIMSNMPAAFSSLEEAIQYLNRILRRSVIFIAKATHVANSSGTLKYAHQYNEPSRDKDPYSGVDFGWTLHTPFQSKPLPRSIISGHMKFNAEVDRWQDAFDRLCLLPDRLGPGVAAILQAAIGTCRISLNATVITEECAFDQYTHDYRAIISSSKITLHGRTAAEQDVNGFSIEPGTLPGLYMVCKFCRDGNIRREAISLMGLADRQCGVWNSVLTAKISTWVMEQEEEGMVDGHIPELARVRVTNVDVDMQTKSADVECLKRTDNEGSITLLRTIIKWDE